MTAKVQGVPGAGRPASVTENAASCSRFENSYRLRDDRCLGTVLSRGQFVLLAGCLKDRACLVDRAELASVRRTSSPAESDRVWWMCREDWLRPGRFRAEHKRDDFLIWTEPMT